MPFALAPLLFRNLALPVIEPQDLRGLPEQGGLVAHHLLHVALRRSNRQAALTERLGVAFDATLFALAADGIVNRRPHSAASPQRPSP